MRIEHTGIFGFQASLRAMRNPMESWERSDSAFYGEGATSWCIENPRLGPEDLKLACKLIRSGSEHRKFLRQIMVWADLELPRYIWQEIDTYKVATVRNSCSTMHKLGHRELVPEDFQTQRVLPDTLMVLNQAGVAYRAKAPWIPPQGLDAIEGYALVRYMKQILPESFLQRATWTGSYETLISMYLQRKNHRLPEWSGPSGICDWIYLLPYMAQFIAAAVGDPE